MAVPTAWTELSTTAASNPPAGTDQRTVADDHLRQVYAFMRALYEGQMVGQVQFPATQNASTNANTLDDYEEGAFTPADGSGAGLSFAVATGNYIKVGKLVTFRLHVTYPVTASGSSAYISGFPFNHVNDEPASSVCVGYVNGTTVTGGLIGIGSSSMAIYSGATHKTNANMSGVDIYMSGSYEAAA